MATWPDLTEYHEALQYPERSLGDPELQKAQIEKDRFGMPKPATGGNAVAYKATEGQNVWAVRCFLRPSSLRVKVRSFTLRAPSRAFDGRRQDTTSRCNTAHGRGEIASTVTANYGDSSSGH